MIVAGVYPPGLESRRGRHAVGRVPLHQVHEIRLPADPPHSTKAYLLDCFDNS
jgi:hypothetical protein